jgi:hypothetical protein
MPRSVSKSKTAPSQTLRQRRLTEHFEGTSSQVTPSEVANPKISTDPLNSPDSKLNSNSYANASDSSDNVTAIKFEKPDNHIDKSPKRRRISHSGLSKTQLTSPVKQTRIAVSSESESDGPEIVKRRKGKSRAILEDDDDEEEKQPRRKILRVRPPSPEEEDGSDLANEIDRDRKLPRNIKLLCPGITGP